MNLYTNTSLFSTHQGMRDHPWNPCSPKKGEVCPYYLQWIIRIVANDTVVGVLKRCSQCKNWSMHSYCVSYLYFPLPIGWRFRFSSKWRTRSQDCFRVLYLSVFHCRNNDLTIAMLDYGAILWSVIMKDKNGNAEVRLALICWFRKSRWISRMWMTILPTPVITMERRLEGTPLHLVIPSKICQSNCEGSFHARRKGVLIGYQQRQQQSSWRKRRLGSRRFSHGWWE